MRFAGGPVNGDVEATSDSARGTTEAHQPPHKTKGVGAVLRTAAAFTQVICGDVKAARATRHTHTSAQILVERHATALAYRLAYRLAQGSA
eukprot:6207169-Pleurochrysis_carterae.AAC.4